MPLRLSRRMALGAVALAAAQPAAAQQARPPVPTGVRDLVVRSFPITSFASFAARETTFGELTFLGGLELQSEDRSFGGFSGLKLDANGQRLTAVSDQGQWLTARLDRGDGRLSGLSEARMAAILGPAGRPLIETGDWDCEALWIEGAAALVACERTHRIYRFETFGREGVRARGQAVSFSTDGQRLPFNRGIEAIGVVPRGGPQAGAIIAITERSETRAGDIRGFLIQGGRTQDFAVRRTNDFDVTDLAFLPNGDLLLLERWFSAWRGVAMRLRRIEAATVRPGALLDGPVIMSAGMSHQIDNMEGLSIHRDDQGRTILSLISDNNFSLLQRTLLLQFSL
jgi:hypothetical protein